MTLEVKTGSEALLSTKGPGNGPRSPTVYGIVEAERWSDLRDRQARQGARFDIYLPKAHGAEARPQA
jgi:hypothetical protein